MAPPLVLLMPLPFREAIDAFRRRAGNPAVSDRWTDFMHDEQGARFTVARSLGYDILGDISSAMDKAISEGTTLSDFSKTLEPLLKAKGWWGKTTDDEGNVVQLGSRRRLETIFNTNMRVSYAAGRWAQIQRTKEDLPYLQYSAVHDTKTRPAHRLWGGIDNGRPVVLPVDHPWWKTHYPPCGWGCRCSVIQLTETAAKKIGITKTPPEGPARTFINPSSGEKIEVPYGIDPGWGYNPGEVAVLSSAVDQAAKQLADQLIDLPAQIAVGALEDDVLAAMGRELSAWRGTLKTPVGDSRVVGTMSGDVVRAIAQNEATGALVLTDRAAVDLPSKLLQGLPQRLASASDVLTDREQRNFLWMVTDADGEKAAIQVARAGSKGGNLITGWRPADTVDTGQWRLL